MQLTSREREIAEILQKQPLISQEEVALKLGISRSSVAVHISNLMKKGVILGKGYVFNRKVSVVVIGEVCLEIKARSLSGNNQIDLAYGGFGMEVSKVLSSFGADTKLISLVGSDELGNSILNDLREQKVDVANIYRHPSRRTVRKIIGDEGLYIYEGCSDQEFERAIAAKELVALNCDWLVVENRWVEFISRCLPEKDDKSPYLCTCRYIEQGTGKFLSKYFLAVLGVPNLNRYDSYVQIGRRLITEGTQNCIISDGKVGVLCINNEGIKDFPLAPRQSFDSKSDLHLLMAGMVYGFSMGYPVRQALRIALGMTSANAEN